MTKHYNVRAVIFDLDGVIIDSNPEIEKFWYQWAEKENVQLDDELVRRFIHGRKGVETIETLFTNSSLTIQKEILQSAQIFDTNMKPATIKGVIDFIVKLAQLKIQVAVVTSSHKERLLKMLTLHSLHNNFEESIAAEDVTKGKPDPEPYARAAEKLNISPQNCLVFEDAVSGIQSAVAAGMHVIGIAGNSSSKQLLSIGCIDIINDYDSLVINNKLITTPNGTQIELLP